MILLLYTMIAVLSIVFRLYHGQSNICTGWKPFHDEGSFVTQTGLGNPFRVGLRQPVLLYGHAVHPMSSPRLHPLVQKRAPLFGALLVPLRETKIFSGVPCDALAYGTLSRPSGCVRIRAKYHIRARTTYMERYHPSNVALSTADVHGAQSRVDLCLYDNSCLATNNPGQAKFFFFLCDVFVLPQVVGRHRGWGASTSEVLDGVNRIIGSDKKEDYVSR